MNKPKTYWEIMLESARRGKYFVYALMTPPEEVARLMSRRRAA